MKKDAPDTLCDLNEASRAVMRSRGSPRLDTSGRDLYGSIYWEQFSLKSAGNYYNGNEAYLNHTTAPAAIPSISVCLPPRSESPTALTKKEAIRINKDPITKIRRAREFDEKKRAAVKARQKSNKTRNKKDNSSLSSAVV